MADFKQPLAPSPFSSIPQTPSRRTGDDGESSDGHGEEQISATYFENNEGKRARETKSVNGSKCDGLGSGLVQHVDWDSGGAQEAPSFSSSVVDTVPIEDLLDGDDTASRSDYDAGDNSELFEAIELELIEDALRDLNRQRRKEPITNYEQRSMNWDIEEPEAVNRSHSSSNHLQDMHGVARLLKKVQAVRAQKRGTLSEYQRSRSRKAQRRFSQVPPAGVEMDPASISQVVQAAAQAALAAAQAAETAVSSLDRNSEAIEELCKKLTMSSPVQPPMDETAKELEEGEEADAEGTSEAKILDIELQQVEITNRLVRQNRITHWVLGFMVVTTLVWRYGVVKFVKRISNTIQNPFQGITEMFSGSKDSSHEHTHKDQNIPRLKLPSILNGEESMGAEADDTHSSKQKEDIFFKLGSILPREDLKKES